MIKSISVISAFCCVVASASQAATIQNLQIHQNQWTVLSFAGTNTVDLIANPNSVNGSFSATYAFSQNGCGANASQSCMPTNLATNVVFADYNHNFGEQWHSKESHSSVSAPLSFSHSIDGADNMFVYFRVTSGSVSLSQVASQVSAVPLPAGGLLLLTGLLGVAGLRRRKNRVA